MISHVIIGALDTDKSGDFYEAVLTPLGYGRAAAGKWAAFRCGEGNPPVLVGAPLEGDARPANGTMFGFRGDSAATVDAAHAAGLKAGGTCDGPPGPRPAGPPGTYAAYLRDPTGNKIGIFHFAG